MGFVGVEERASDGILGSETDLPNGVSLPMHVETLGTVVGVQS